MHFNVIVFQDTYGGHGLSVGTEDLLDTVSLFEELGHGALVLDDGTAELGSLGLLKFGGEELLEANIELMTSKGSVVANGLDLDLLNSLEELADILDTNVLEAGQAGSSTSCAHVEKDVALFLGECPCHGVVQGN
jgi:hypothetical protein